MGGEKFGEVYCIAEGHRSVLPLECCRATVVAAARTLCRFIEGRADIERRGAAQIARLILVMRAAAVHRVAIIPDHEIADPPFMAVDELRLGREIAEVVQQEPALRHRPADDVRGM